MSKRVSIYINGVFLESRRFHDDETEISIEASLSSSVEVAHTKKPVDCEFKIFKQGITEHLKVRNAPYSPRQSIISHGCTYKVLFVSDELKIVDGRIELQRKIKDGKKE